MKILAIETSCDIASVSLLEDDKLILELKGEAPKNHSEMLMPLIDRLLKETKTKLDDIELFACDNGPGSFTGIRIGLSTIKAFCDVKNKPCVAISSLESLVYEVKGKDGLICALIDAKNNNAYYGIFESKGGKYTKIQEFAFDNIENILLSYIPQDEAVNNKLSINSNSNLKKNIFFVGNCGILYKDVIKSYLKCDEFILEDTIPSSKYVGIAAFDKYKEGLYTNSLELSALYIKKSSAEE